MHARMSVREMIEVLEAYERGEEIQADYDYRTEKFGWFTVDNPKWDFIANSYRIKPKELNIDNDNR